MDSRVIEPTSPELSTIGERDGCWPVRSMPHDKFSEKEPSVCNWPMVSAEELLVLFIRDALVTLVPGVLCSCGPQVIVMVDVISGTNTRIFVHTLRMATQAQAQMVIPVRGLMTRCLRLSSSWYTKALYPSVKLIAQARFAYPMLATESVTLIFLRANSPVKYTNNSSMSFGLDSDDEPRQLLEPLSQRGEDREGRLIHGVLFGERSQAPLHTLFWVPNATGLIIHGYQLPKNLACAKFICYDALSGKYEDAEVPLNVSHRGWFMVFHNKKVPKRECPGLAQWEQEARESTEMMLEAKEAEEDEKTWQAVLEARKRAETQDIPPSAALPQDSSKAVTGSSTSLVSSLTAIAPSTASAIDLESVNAVAGSSTILAPPSAPHTSRAHGAGLSLKWKAEMQMSAHNVRHKCEEFGSRNNPMVVD
ncbi:hypothetical protein C8R44DRAFT_735617 [Mycena epipterygia]|nr:hypothetical protein C8R44DRAFT_735617 [Mycena epipterygia]